MRALLTRACSVAVVAGLALAAAGSATSASADAPTTVTALTATPTTAFTTKNLMSVRKPNGMHGTQGLAYRQGVYYVTSDEYNGNSRLIGFTANGTRVLDSGLIPGGHAQGVDVWGDTAYITSTGLATSAIKAYDIPSRQFTRTYPLPGLNGGAVAAIDRQHGQIVVVRGGAGNPHILITMSLATGAVLRTVPVKVGGETQGLTIYEGKAVILSTYDGDNTPHGRRNELTVHDLATGTLTKTVPLAVHEETEGLTINRREGRVMLGAREHERIVEIQIG
jgi:glutamine cyclotransferase